MQRPGTTPAAGLAWTHPAAQFVYPQCEGRDVHRCFGNRALSWALLCIGDVTWRGFEPQRLTPASAALPDWPHQLGVAPLIRRGKLQVTSRCSLRWGAGHRAVFPAVMHQSPAGRAAAHYRGLRSLMNLASVDSVISRMALSPRPASEISGKRQHRRQTQPRMQSSTLDTFPRSSLQQPRLSQRNPHSPLQAWR